jgi:hypothetical protein
MQTLARISHRNSAPGLRISESRCATATLSLIRKEPRCQQSVAQNNLILEPLKAAAEASFDAGLVTSDAGAVLLRVTDRAIGMIDRFATCFDDAHLPELTEHAVDAGGSASIWDCARL